jgi:hypothetical protein
MIEFETETEVTAAEIPDFFENSEVQTKNIDPTIHDNGLLKIWLPIKRKIDMNAPSGPNALDDEFGSWAESAMSLWEPGEE